MFQRLYSMKAIISLLLILLFSVIAEATTVRVYYDTGYGNRIAIRGNKAPFNWTTGVNATWTTGNIWTYTWANTVGDVEIKPLLNDQLWATGANYKIPAGATVNIYPFFGPAKGTFARKDNFYSPQLGNSRTLLIYLPPSYNENRLKRYPVLYMHDGQNIFDAATSFGGVEWGVDETANSLIGSGKMEEAIIVGVYNSGGNRLYEYTPCCDASYGGGGADYYEKFLIETVKPYIDANYRTLPKKENTALMGSSLGGLVSFYIGYRRPDVFGKVGAISSSFWWENQDLVKTVEAATTKPALKIYLDAGTNNDGLTETTRMKNALIVDKFVQGKDLYFYSATGASHNEYYWAQRVYLPLQFLFAPGSTVY